MNMKRNNGGFTLVEFVVTIAVASMITLAATSMLLLGLRIHHKSNATAGQLNTVSMLYSVMETIASENNVTYTPPSNPTLDKSWTIVAGSTTIKYDDSIDSMLLNGTTFVNNIIDSEVTNTDNLLTIDMESDQNNNYTFSIYCRKGGAEAGS